MYSSKLHLPARLRTLKPFAFAAVAGLLFAISSLLVSCAGNGDSAANNQSTDLPTVSAAIQPAFTNIKIAPGLYQIDPQRDTVLTMPSGTSLEIPAGIFLTMDDRPVTSQVAISFREFHNAADLITAGIPMRLKHDQGDEDWLQTAGMFEINGTLENQPIKIAPGKRLNVGLASQVGGAYDSWKFDPATDNWVNLNTVTNPTGVAGAQRDTVDAETQRLLALAANPPVNLVAANKKRTPINIAEPDIRACPRLQDRKGQLILLYAGTKQKEDLKALKSNKWYEPKLTPTSDPAVYQLTMKDEDFEEHVFPVTPNMTPSEEQAAQADYAQKLTEFEAAKELLSKRKELVSQQNDFRRSLSLQGFGIYNCDAILQQDCIHLFADFKLGNLPEAVRKLVTVYLVTGDQRTVIAYSEHYWEHFRFDPATDNYLVAVMPGDKIAYFSPADFKAQREALKAAKGEHFTFEMREFQKPLYNMDELEGCLATIQGIR